LFKKIPFKSKDTFLVQFTLSVLTLCIQTNIFLLLIILIKGLCLWVQYSNFEGKFVMYDHIQCNIVRRLDMES